MAESIGNEETKKVSVLKGSLERGIRIIPLNSKTNDVPLHQPGGGGGGGGASTGAGPGAGGGAGPGAGGGAGPGAGGGKHPVQTKNEIIRIVVIRILFILKPPYGTGTTKVSLTHPKLL